MRELIVRVADNLKLTEEERVERLSGRTESLFASRVHWAKTYLKQAGLVEQPKRATLQITPRGRELLATKPQRIDAALLQQYPEFRSFFGGTKADIPEPLQSSNRAGSNSDGSPSAAADAALAATPDDQIEAAYRTLELSLRDALLARVLESSPAFFEKLIVDLLVAMGYGGSRSNAGERLGGTADGGVDGVISEDQLGLDRVFLQAKRYKPGSSVGSDAVQGFVGALHLKGSQKGVMITTSTFTKAAVNAAAGTGNLRVVLIDGEELTRLMVRFGVGVRSMRTIDIKRVDLDYFEDTDLE